MKAFLFCALFSYFCGRSNAFAGIRNIFSGEDEAEVKKRGALEFALRAMELGMDLDKQAAIDKRGFELENKPKCPSCNPPKSSKIPDDCKNGFYPVFSNGDKGCTCITHYECCPMECVEPKENCVTGSNYTVTKNNCCGCPTNFCEECPKIEKKCANKCDKPKDRLDERGCPSFECIRPERPTSSPPTCNTTCQDLQTRTDDCGYHTSYCKCLQPPQCRPGEPEKKKCHEVVKKFFPTYGCDQHNNTTIEDQCYQCYYWIHQPVKPLIPIKENCTKCQIKKVIETDCGGYEEKCDCLVHENCHPPRPEDIACHELKEVKTKGTFQCNEYNTVEGRRGEDGCSQCYTWKYAPKEKTNHTKVCNSSCMYKRPLSQECGHGEECVCKGKDKNYCQPEEPQVSACFITKKIMVENSYMCNEKNACEQCWIWDFKKRDCAEEKPKTCETCQRREVSHDDCNCRTERCINNEVDCPAKPEKGVCDEEPVATETNIWTSTFDGACTPCSTWKVTKKVVSAKDECNLRNLPNVCYRQWKEPGTCGETITKCASVGVACEELFTTSKCPNSHTLVTMKGQCNQARHGCVDCANLVKNLPTKKDDDDCYEDHPITILESCELKIPMRSKCKLEDLDDLRCEPGLRKKVFTNKCGCPVLRCIGCPSSKRAVDVMLLLDSSGSIGKKNWTKIIKKIQKELIGDLMTNPGSRMEIAKFGTECKVIASLSNTTSGASLNNQGYISMGSTNLGKAMNQTLPDFKKGTTGSEAKKVLIVITDAKATDEEEVKKAVKQWGLVVEQIFALGFGAVDKAGLELIKPDNQAGLIVFQNDLDKLENEIMRQVIPKVCDKDVITYD